MKSQFYRRIMVATDGSKNAKKAVSCGIDLAKVSEAEVYAVHVIPIAFFTSISGPRAPSWDEIYDVLKEDGNRMVAQVQEEGDSEGVVVEPVLLEGDPGREIIKFAEDNDIDLIVVGTLGVVEETFGNTAIERFLLGSVADDVMRHSKVQVLVVR